MSAYSSCDAASTAGRLAGESDQAPNMLYTVLDELMGAWGSAAGHSPMATIAEARTVLDRLERIHVSTARRTGSSWAEIGSQLGLTRQAAQQRFGRKKAGHNQLTGQETIEEAL